MKHKILFQSLLGVLTLVGFAGCAVADGFTTTKETLSCGKASYVIESPCKKATTDDLNTCKAQTLRIQHGQADQAVKLPHLTAEASKQYEKLGGELDELFVVGWGCAVADNRGYLTLHYSVGGGSGPTAEVFTTYDEAGKLLGKGKAPQAAYKQFSSVRKPVRSIMSD